MKISIKNVVIFVLACCIGSSCLAESKPPAVNAEADEFVVLANEWLPQHCFHSGKFEQTRTLAGLPQPLLSNGRYIYSCEKGFVWATESPIFEALIYRNNGKKTYIVDGHGEMKPLNARAEKALAELLSGILGGNLDILKKRFDVEASSANLTLTPSRKQMRKFLTEIKVEKNAGLPVTRLSFASGDTQHIAIDEIHTYDTLGEELCVNNALPEDSCLLAFGESYDHATK